MKLSELQRYLAQHQIELAFFSSPDQHPDPAITYFTQFQPSYGLLLVTPTKASLYLSKLDAPPHRLPVAIHPYDKDWEQKLASPNLKKIALHYDCLSLSQAQRLRKMFPSARLVDISEKLRELRMGKTPLEIQKISRACQITDAAFQALLQELPKKTVRTEKDVALFLEQQIRQHGGDLAFPAIVAMGKNAAIPHHRTGMEKLVKGFLLLDFGAKYQHYCADMTRVIHLGKPTATEVRFYRLLLSAQQAAIALVSEGEKYADLEKVSRKKLGKYSQNFIHSLGHGIGLDVHEPPNYGSEVNYKIEKNQMFTIEPGIYFPGKFGLRIEDTILFDGEVKVLTKATKELCSISW